MASASVLPAPCRIIQTATVVPINSQVIHGVWSVGFSSLSGIMSVSGPKCTTWSSRADRDRDPRRARARLAVDESGRWRPIVNICILRSPHGPAHQRDRPLYYVRGPPCCDPTHASSRCSPRALLLGACRDEPTAPIAAESATPRFAAGGNGNGNGNGPSSLDLIEDDYAGGLLDKENTNRYREYAVSAPDKLPQKYQSSERGKDATYSMVQMAKEWASLSAATSKEIQDLRANGFGNLKGTRETTHFVLHYTTQGDWAVPTVDADGNGYPDFIDAAAKSWEEIYAREVGQLGYPAPEADDHRRRHGGQQVPRVLQGHAVLRLLRAREHRPTPR